MSFGTYVSISMMSFALSSVIINFAFESLTMYSSSCGVKTLFVGIATAPILHIAKSENKYSSEFFKYTKTSKAKLYYI